MNAAVVVLDFKGLGCNMEQDHAEPSPIVPSRWIRIIPILILHAASLMLVSVVLCNVAPGVQEYYRQANIEIPEATLNIAWLSDRVIVYWLPIFFCDYGCRLSVYVCSDIIEILETLATFSV